LAKIDQRAIGRERPRDDAVKRLGIVRIPDRSGSGGGGLLSGFSRENRNDIFAFGEHDTAGEPGYPGANDGDSLLHRDNVSKAKFVSINSRLTDDRPRGANRNFFATLWDDDNPASGRAQLDMTSALRDSDKAMAFQERR
jgi:hypothetical protein